MPISAKLIKDAVNETRSYHDISLQRIGPVTVNPAPNSVQLSFVTDWPAAPIIEIFRSRPFTPANAVVLAFPLFYGWRTDHSARLGNLTQDTSFFYRITAGTENPKLRPAVVTGQFFTGTRQARITVSDILVFRSGDTGDFLTNPRGCAEWNVQFQVFDLDTGKVLTQRRYPADGGFTSVCRGSTLDAPFGKPPLIIDRAPERLRLFVSVTDEDTSDFPWGFNGIGTGLPADPPMPDHPTHGDIDIADWAEALTDVELPDAVGDSSQGAELNSGAVELHYIMRTRIDTVVRTTTQPPLPVLSDGAKARLKVDRIGTSIPIGGGKGMFITQLHWAADRQLYFRQTDQTQVELTGRVSKATVGEWEKIEGEISEAVTALASDNDVLDLIATSPRGGALLGSINPASQDHIKWNPLGGTITGQVTALRAASGELHLFGVGQGGGVEHGMIAQGARKAQWTYMGGKEFTGAITAAQAREEWHLFAANCRGEIFHRSARGDAEWESLGELPPLVSLVARPADRGRRIVLLGVAEDRTVFAKVWTGGDWEPSRHQWTKAGNLDELDHTTPKVRAAKKHSAPRRRRA